MKNIIILIILCGVGFSAYYIHNNQTPQSLGEATFDLAVYAGSVSNGNNKRLNPKLIEYIYSNRKEFPQLRESSSYQEKVESLSFSLENLHLALSQSPPSHQISKQQAMLLSIMGSVSGKILNLSIEHIKSLDKADASYQRTLEGTKIICSGGKSVLSGYFSVLFVESEGEDVESILLEGLNTFVPEMINDLPKTYRDEAKVKIQRTIGTNLKPHLRSNYERIISLF